MQIIIAPHLKKKVTIMETKAKYEQNKEKNIIFGLVSLNHVDIAQISGNPHQAFF
jgi:hypothetical protein